MAVGYKPIGHGFGDQLFEWAEIEDSEFPNHISVPPFTEMTVQLMAVTGTPTVQVEWSLNAHEDVTKTWSLANDPSHTEISLTAAGVTGATVLESAILMRPRITAGTTVTARVRIKASPIR